MLIETGGIECYRRWIFIKCLLIVFNNAYLGHELLAKTHKRGQPKQRKESKLSRQEIQFKSGQKLTAHKRPHLVSKDALKFLCAAIIAQKPSTGYALIKEIQDMFAGQYTPGPSAIYPALHELKEESIIVAQQVGRKIIYDFGIESDRNQYDLDSAKQKITRCFDDAKSRPLIGVRQALNQLESAIRTCDRQIWESPARLDEIADALAEVIDLFQTPT